MSRFATTPAQLRTLVNEARTDPHVTQWTVTSQRILAGPRPARCSRCARRYRTTGSLSNLGWHPCHCGGHFLLHCGGCALLTVEPVLAYDCRPLPPSPAATC